MLQSPYLDPRVLLYRLYDDSLYGFYLYSSCEILIVKYLLYTFLYFCHRTTSYRFYLREISVASLSRRPLFSINSSPEFLLSHH